MSLHAPSIFSRAKRWLSRRRSPYPSVRGDGDEQERADASFFTNARDVTVNGGQFTLTQTNNYVKNTISSGKAVFELLQPYACLDATKDSSARFPPPKCHPGTREKIRDRLTRWLVSEHDDWKMLWVRGFAGTGKSAVAQSFADSCSEEKSLGGSYFFSRTAGRSNGRTVVPTLVYQLAGAVPEYRSLIERQLAENPILLENSSPIQFRKLIVEPFALLQRERPRKPIAIILDGLDECKGENAQRLLLDMITDAVRTHPELPLRWLIFSRPEAHLKNAFSRNSDCGREELIIDAECRVNVERYVTNALAEIKVKYNDVTPAIWPSQERFEELLGAVSGLFVLASTCLSYIGDPEEADPDSQLTALLKFMRQLQGIISRNPLASLDLLYSRILDDISPTVYKTTWKILAHLSHQKKIDTYYRLRSAEALCNFLRLDQRAFYKALRGLHSVMGVPDPKDANNYPLRFHHASFQDFLLDPNRSGKFTTGTYEAPLDIIKSGIYWYEIDVTNFHMDDEWNTTADHRHDSLPGLTWVSSDNNQMLISKSIIGFVRHGLFSNLLRLQLEDTDEDLIAHVSNIDYRYWRAGNVFHLAKVCRLDPLTSNIRAKPSNATDQQLLTYFNVVIQNGISKPARLPLKLDIANGRWLREYFFIGHGDKSIILWITKSPSSGWYTCLLRSDKEPSEDQISRYQKDISSIGWNEVQARSYMI